MTLVVPSAAAGPAGQDPMVPRLFTVVRTRREVPDTVTLTLAPADGAACSFRPGQFSMLYAFGVGEIPISISGDPDDPTALVHTLRRVGAVSEALAACRPGATVGVRGPFGSRWPLEEAVGSDLVMVAGGLGLAPLRPAILSALRERRRFGSVVILYGARSPADILYARRLAAWGRRPDVTVRVIVDHAVGSWDGPVGVVTQLLDKGDFDRRHAVAMICGPEVMMRYAAQALLRLDVPDDRIYVSMERNMKCAVGFCGRCQYGGLFICRDGPVLRYDHIAPLVGIWEL